MELEAELLRKFPNITHIECITHRYAKFNYRANCSNPNRNKIDKTILMKALEFTFTLKFDPKQNTFSCLICNYNYHKKSFFRNVGVMFECSSILHVITWLLQYLKLIDENEKEILIDVYE